MGRAFPVLTSTHHIMATHRNGLTPHRIRQKFNLQPQAYFPRLHSKFLLILYSLVSNQALPPESLQQIGFGVEARPHVLLAGQIAREHTRGPQSPVACVVRGKQFQQENETKMSP